MDIDPMTIPDAMAACRDAFAMYDIEVGMIAEGVARAMGTWKARPGD